MIEIRELKKSDTSKPFLEFINELIAENVYIQIDKKVTPKEEQEWPRDMKKKVNADEAIWLGAWEGKKLVASTQSRRGLWNERNNAGLGIAVLNDYRRRGLGEKLLRTLIKVTKKKFSPKNIYLSVAAPNKPAQSLYRKLGFKKLATFPSWAKKNGKYFDVDYMILKADFK